jgi:hypothetical protein
VTSYRDGSLSLLLRSANSQVHIHFAILSAFPPKLSVYATSVLNTSYKMFAMRVQKRLIEDGMIRIMKLTDAVKERVERR